MTRANTYLVAVALALTGCPKSTDPTPEIEVTRGAAERIGLIPNRNETMSKTSSARVHPLVAGQELGGPNATGKPGD